MIVSKHGREHERGGDPLTVRLEVESGTHHVVGSMGDTITLGPGLHELDLAGRRNLAAALRDHVRASFATIYELP